MNIHLFLATQTNLYDLADQDVVTLVLNPMLYNNLQDTAR